MSDSASQANELRLLEQKRLRDGLSPAEDARRGVLAAEAPAPRGFDVNAAAAEIRALRACEGTSGASPASETRAATRCDADRSPPRREETASQALMEADAPPSRDAAALEPPQSAFAARLPAAELPLAVPAAAAADPTVPAAPSPEPSLAAAAMPEAAGEDAPPEAAEFVPFFPGAALASHRPRDLAAPAEDPPPEAAHAAEAAGGDAAPVYDAASYGLDPSDPNAVAWAAWYAAQGWDPATAYAYAQRMNAEAEASAPTAEPDEEPERPALVASDLAGSLSAPGEPPAAPADAPADLLPELPAEAILEPVAGAVLEPTPDALPRPTANLEDAIPELPAEPIEPAVVPGEEPTRDALLQPLPEEPAADSIPELPPIALEALDGSEVAAPAEAPQRDVAIDLGPGFDAEPPEAALPVGAPPAESAQADLAPDVGWAERAVPARDEPVDFSAFDAEPAALGAASTGAADAQRTAMWELRDALQEERAAATEDPPVEIAPAGDEMPRADLDLGPALAWHDAPTTSGEPPVTGPSAQQREPDDSLELPPPEPIELQDDDILEVGDDVVEIAEPATPLAPEPPSTDAFALTGEPPAASPDTVSTPSGLPALDDADASPPAPPEPTIAFGATASDPPFAAEAEPPPLGMAWTEPEPSRSRQAEPSPAPAAFVAGTHRVVLHTADGQVRRGTVADIALDAPEVLLTPQGGGATEGIPAEQIKAIFFMLPLGQAPADPDGMRVRVTFRDGRQVAGFSADYAPEHPGFFVIPADTRTHTARIWVYRSAVRQVSVS